MGRKKKSTNVFDMKEFVKSKKIFKKTTQSVTFRGF